MLKRFRCLAVAALFAAPLLASVIAVSVLPDMALAQAAIPDDGGGGMLDSLLTTLEPRITELLSIVVVGLLGIVTMALRTGMTAVTAMIREHLGLQAERIWKETMHQALRSGVLKTEGEVFASEGHRRDAVVDYARRSSGEFIANLGVPTSVLNDLALAKINEQKGTVASAVPR